MIEDVLELKEVLWSGREVLEATGGKGECGWEATGASIDTRTLELGDMYVGVRGLREDGGKYAGVALERGASAVLAHERWRDLCSGGVFVGVEDGGEALSALGAASRGRFGGRVYAVTGSAGKTGTKELTAAALGRVGRTHKAEASYNNALGAALTLVRAPRDWDYCVMELGTNGRGEIGELSRLCRPHAVVVTSIGAAHTEGLGSIGGVAAEKACVFEGMEGGEGSAALLPGNDAYTDLLEGAAREAGCERVWFFGEGEECEVRLLSCEASGFGTRSRASVFGEEVEWTLKTPGRAHANNALAALWAGRLEGGSLEDLARALEGVEALSGRGVWREVETSEGGRCWVLDDTYNANPLSMREALRVLGEMSGGAMSGRKVAALGEMAELGERSEEEHRGLAKDLERAGCERVWLCGEGMRALHEELPLGVRGGWWGDAEGMGEGLREGVRGGDVLLAKGSRATGVERALSAAFGEEEL